MSNKINDKLLNFDDKLFNYNPSIYIKTAHKTDKYYENPSHHVSFGFENDPSIITAKKAPYYKEENSFSNNYENLNNQNTHPHRLTFDSKVNYNSSSFSQNEIIDVINTTKYKSVLMKLDESEAKFVISEKKYGELWRKYQVSNQSVKGLNRELIKSEQKRLEELLDLQNKFYQLEQQNSVARQMLQQKEEIILAINQKFKEKSTLVQGLQNKIQNLQRNLTVNHRQVQTRSEQNQLRVLELQQSEKSLHRQNGLLKQQISRLQSIIEQATLEKGKLLNDIEVLYMKQKQIDKQHIIEVKQLEEQYKKWLDDTRNDKIRLIADYEKQVEQYKNIQRSTNKQIENHLESQEWKTKQKIIERQQEIAKKNKQIEKLNKQVEIIRKEKKQLVEKVSKQQNLINSELKSEIQYLKDYKSKMTSHNKELSQQKLHQKQKYSQIYSEFKILKNDFNLLWQQKSQLQKSKKFLQQDIHSLNQQLKKSKNQVFKFQSDELYGGSNWKQMNKKLADHIFKLEQQSQQLTRELFAQRLESARLKQQLQQQASILKRQYQLSLQNVQKSLSSRINQVKQQKSLQTSQKQRIYLQLRQLQRKYELLVSEMLTVDDMMAIATKVHKRHSKFVKK